MKSKIILLGRLLLTTIFVLLSVVTVVFFLIHLVPGDPVLTILGENAGLKEIDKLRQELGLHLPIHEQWFNYLGDVIRFDFGESFYYHLPVAPIIFERFVSTLLLATASFLVAMAVGIPLGIVAALRYRQSWDGFATLIALLGVSVPNFVLGPLLILCFSIQFQLLPIGSNEGAMSLVLPSFTLGLSFAAILTRMSRAAVLDVLNEQFLITARAKGISEFRVVFHHILRNAFLPILTTLGLQIGVLLGGAVITEAIFSWPGLGSLLVDSIDRRDYQMLQACVLVVSFTYVAINVLTDVLYCFLDPRITRTL
jgi:ABC-type dipeptide/oligopeptide/nickel transport system permease component